MIYILVLYSKSHPSDWMQQNSVVSRLMPPEGNFLTLCWAEAEAQGRLYTAAVAHWVTCYGL